MTWTAQMISFCMKFDFGREVLISYLPLSHVAAQMTDIIGPITIGGTIFFAQPDALKVTPPCDDIQNYIPQLCRTKKYNR